MTSSDKIELHWLSACWGFGRQPLEEVVQAYLERHSTRLAIALGLGAGVSLRRTQSRGGVDLVFEAEGEVVAIVEIKISAVENFSERGFQSVHYLSDHRGARAILVHLNGRLRVVEKFADAGWEVVDLGQLGLLPNLARASTSAAAVLAIAGRRHDTRDKLVRALVGELPREVEVSWRLRDGARVSHWLDVSMQGRPDILIGYDRRTGAVGISTHQRAVVSWSLPEDEVGILDNWDGQGLRTCAAWKWVPRAVPNLAEAVKDVARVVQTVHHAA